MKMMLMRGESKQLCEKKGEGWMGRMKMRKRFKQMKNNMGKIFVNFGAPKSA